MEARGERLEVKNARRQPRLARSCLPLTTNLWPLFLLFLTACFHTRDPEPPLSASDFSPPNQPEILLSNFTAAVTHLNVANYERCFVRSGFVFNPDPRVARNNQGIFTNWTLQPSELDVIRNLDRVKDGISQNKLAFANPRTNNINADSVEYTADYRLQIQHLDTTYRRYIFTGNLVFSMLRDSENEWRIGRWRDAANDSSASWTELKQHFVTR